MRGRVKDIGPGGLFIALPQPLPIQQEIDVCMRLPIGSERRRIRARGIVVRQVFPDRESHLIPGVGIRFTEVDDASRHLISTFVSESTGDRLSPAPDPAEPVTT
jgi:Tfp pilus assembly protein PilZ